MRKLEYVNYDVIFQNDDDTIRFMEELEEDEEARKNINIYRNADKASFSTAK